MSTATPDPAATAAYAAAMARLFPAHLAGDVAALDDDEAGPWHGRGAAQVEAFPVTPGFTIRARIGRGGMGEVYRAWDQRLDRVVALKFLRAGTEEDARRLEIEAQLLVKCTHPNIVHVYQVAPYTETRVFLAMEYVPGTTLHAWLRERPRRPSEILARLLEVGRALEAAHEVGVIHRDVQPQNVMIDESGCAKLIDFGLAHVERGAPRAANDDPAPLVGTFDYIAPEHRRGDVCTSRSDQYSFCVVLFECLYGVVPDAASTTPTPALPRRPWLPRQVRRALQRGLQRDPGQRWPAMDHLLHQLAHRPWWRRPWVRTGALASLATLLLGAGLYVLLTGRAAQAREAQYAQCVAAIADKHASIQREANAVGMTTSIPSQTDDHAGSCRRAADGDRAAVAAVQGIARCLDIHAEALGSFAALRDDGQPERRDGWLRFAWGAVRSPLPPFPMCSSDNAATYAAAAATLSAEAQAAQARTLLHLVRLRLLLQQQKYADARDLFAAEAVIPRLRGLGTRPALAEALLYAGQVARRFKQQAVTVRIDDLDAEELLNAAEVEASDSGLDALVSFIRLERVNLALDEQDVRGAGMLLQHARKLEAGDDVELRVRHLQTKARHAAADKAADRAVAAVEQALELTRASPALAATTMLVELLGARAIYVDAIDRPLAHAHHATAVAAARAQLGEQHYLTGILAANASRHAFEVAATDAGEAWGRLGLTAFAAAFGTDSLAVSQLEYDLAYNLLMAGEGQRALAHADRALGHARSLAIATEVTFSLHMRSAIELRIGRTAAAVRSATEAVASAPPSLAHDAGFKHMFDVGLLDAIAADRSDRTFEQQLAALQSRLDRPASGALPETRDDLRFLRARVLARQGRVRPALAQMGRFGDELAELTDRHTRGDAHLLRAYLSEQVGDEARARRDACAALRIFAELGTDGAARRGALAGDGTAAVLAPSPAVLRTCADRSPS